MKVTHTAGRALITIASYASAICCSALIGSVDAAGLVWREDTLRLNANGSETLQLERAELTIDGQGAKSNSTIVLPVVRLKATGRDGAKPLAPVLFIPGGPGLSGIQHLRIGEFRRLFTSLTQERDVYLYDPRGTGEAKPSLEPSRDKPLIASDSLATREKFLAQLSSLSADVNQRLERVGLSGKDFGFLQAVDDVDRVRKALGVDKLDLVGHSFGTQVAVEYAQRFPQRVGRMTLVSLRPVEHAHKSPQENDAFLSKLLAEAAKDRAIAEKLPDLLGSLKKILAKLDNEPLAVTLKTRRGDETFYVGGFALRFMITAFFMNDPDNIAHLPKLIYELETQSRPWGVAFNIGRMLQGGVALTWFTNELSVAQSPAQAERHARESASSILQQSMNFPIPEISAAWNVAPAVFGTDYAKLRAVPILIVSGTLDGVTPAAHSVAFAEKLSSASLLRVTNGGHQSLLRSADVAKAITEFHAGRTVPAEIGVAAPRFISLTPPNTPATK
jgi:pimeloyl-ACP methyl ester carboxylesterase